MASASCSITTNNTSTASAYYSNNSHPYANGFPTGSGSITLTTNQWAIILTLGYTSPNFNQVSENGSNDGDTSYNYSSTVGAKDLYALQSLPITPSSISVVQLRMIARKSDSGTRAGQTILVSGATTDLGNSTILSSSYTHI